VSLTPSKSSSTTSGTDNSTRARHCI
jgi:hypothetical protein